LLIFVGNDALAFFDANESPNRKTNVVELKHKSRWKRFTKT